MKLLSFRHRLIWVLVASLAGATGPLYGQDSAINRKVQPGDGLLISVVDEPDLAKVEKKVDSDNKITFPFLGELDVKDKSTAEIEKLIRDGLDRDWIINPQVSVVVVLYAEKVVSVNGYVGRPGPVKLPADRRMSLVEAISSAGDVNRMGNRKKIQLSRKGVTKVYNLDDLMKITESTNQVYVEPDDIIQVPQGLF